MSTSAHPPSVAITAPGLCHNLPLRPHPVAGEVTVSNGVPAVPLIVGALETGQQAVLTATSLEYLDDLILMATLARARLAMFVPDHGLHPFDGPAAAA